jgi:acyl-CoA synthetase (AMP-forming)/AMP-acid ligase II
VKTPGRIFVRNDTLFEGYTGGGRKQVIDGFMETGDVGHLDTKGRLYVDGRSDDMIVSGGKTSIPPRLSCCSARIHRYWKWRFWVCPTKSMGSGW